MNKLERFAGKISIKKTDELLHMKQIIQDELDMRSDAELDNLLRK